MESAFTVNDVLGQLKRGESIKVDDICAATSVHGVTRRDLERRIEAAGWVYSIRYDAYMPPDWVEAMRGRGSW